MLLRKLNLAGLNQVQVSNSTFLNFTSSSDLNLYMNNAVTDTTDYCRKSAI